MLLKKLESMVHNTTVFRNKELSQGREPVGPATWEAEVGVSLEP
jgi:hypothetical protein